LKVESVRKGASGTATIAVGGSFFLVDLSQLEELGLTGSSLAEGTDLSEAELSILKLAAEAREAEKRGLALLAHAEQSAFMLHAKLEQREFSPKAVRLAIDRLLASGLLDDRRYARAYARSRLGRRGSKAEGPASLERSLRERGIDRTTAIAAIHELMGSETEPQVRLDALSSAWAKELKRSGGDRDEARRRLRELGFKSGELDDYFNSLS
jgi:SOS response regulatory protein OraA/RecX